MDRCDGGSLGPAARLEQPGASHSMANLDDDETGRSSADGPGSSFDAHVDRALRGPEGEMSFFRARRGDAPRPAAGLARGKEVGDFRLVALIGEGGMGQVWEAEQVSLGRRVAMKFVRPERVTDKDLKLFQREARAGGRLHHPGIVEVFAYGDADGLAWIAMELVEGCWTLHDFLDELSRQGSLPEAYDRHVAEFVAQVAEAVHAAHEAGVIHRDIKPHNILITSEDRPKVTDFGLAKIMDETALSMTGDFAGTYFYMSPEQVAARRSGIDHRTDVFSLGVVLYEMLALRRPFEGDTTHQVADQILVKDPPELGSIRSRIPRDLAVICEKALEKDRDRRYLMMSDLALDLRRFLANEPIEARPASKLYKLQKWSRRHPAKSLGAVAAVVVFAVVSALLVVISRAWRDEARAKEDLELSLERERALSDFHAVDSLLGREKELWPAHPEHLASMEEWIDTARRLSDRLPQWERRSEASDVSRASWLRTPEDVVSRLGAFQATRLMEPDGFSALGVWTLPRRLASAEALRDGFAPGGPYAIRWVAALPAIREAYAELELTPQMGLVPLGKDPGSGLWEFWHVQSGDEPKRDERGELLITGSTGLVLVLLPGGKAWIGGQATDREARHYDPLAQADEGPVHELGLSAFFLSKYEMTQGQWQRLTGKTPSEYGPHTRWVARLSGSPPPSTRLPVESISWQDCAEVLPRFALELPSEAQWEYAARAGTETPWHCGADSASIDRFANLADATAADMQMQLFELESQLDDGFGLHAPVGSFAPNGFGLHDVHGNVWEWCLDYHASNAYQPGVLPKEDPVRRTPEREALGKGEPRVARGGAFAYTSFYARSSFRAEVAASHREFTYGVRPARPVLP